MYERKIIKTAPLIAVRNEKIKIIIAKR